MYHNSTIGPNFAVEIMSFSLFNPFDFNDPVSYAIPGFILLIVIELVFYFTRKVKLFPLGDAFASIGLGLGSIILDLGVKAITVGWLLWLFQFRIFDTLSPATVQELLNWQWHKEHWWVWLILLFGQDFTFYWHHRLSHDIRILWAAHVSHHSSQYMHFSTALRQSWLELLYKDLWYFWLALLGFHPLMIISMHSINLIYQYWPHTEIIGKLGWFDKVFNSPSNHRVHHATNLQYLDKNHGGIFMIWDHLFGTYQAEEEKPVYGITENIHTNNLLKITFHELVAIIRDVRRAPDWKSKLRYLFDAPGWKHDGPDRRTKVLRRQSPAH